MPSTIPVPPLDDISKLEVEMAKLHPLLESSSLYTMPFHPRVCRENPVLIKLISYIHLTITERLVESVSASWTRINVRPLMAPIPIWEKIADIFGKHSNGRYAARLERLTPENSSGPPIDLHALQIVWKVYRDEQRNFSDEARLRLVPIDVNACRHDPVFFKVFSYVQLSIAEQLIVNRSLKWTVLAIDVRVGPLVVWERVRDLFNLSGTGYTAECRMYRSPKGDIQALYIEWKT